MRDTGKRKSQILEVIDLLNPWWSNPRGWMESDADLRTVKEGGLTPRLFRLAVENWVKPVLARRGWAVRVLRGPRRVGKTTLMKMLVRETIKLGFPPRAIVYMSLDDERIRLLLKELGLKGVLETVIEEARAEGGGRAIVIVDEATFYEEWALAVKNLHDQGVLRRPGTVLIVTGSYSLELSEAKRLLEGRMGSIAGDSRGQRFMYPFRFSEVLESLSPVVDEAFKKLAYKGHALREERARLTLLDDLSTPGALDAVDFMERLWG